MAVGQALHQPPNLVRQVTLGPASYYEIQASSRDPQTRTTTLHLRTQGSAYAFAAKLPTVAEVSGGVGLLEFALPG